MSPGADAAYDPQGQFLAWVAPGYLDRARRNREVTVQDGIVRLSPSAIKPLNELPPEVKRRLFLAKHGTARK